MPATAVAITAMLRLVTMGRKFQKTRGIWPVTEVTVYFACDPPTAPTKPRDQLVCGALIGLVSFAAFEWLGVVTYLLVGLLAGNLLEAGRRLRIAARRHSNLSLSEQRPLARGR